MYSKNKHLGLNTEDTLGIDYDRKPDGTVKTFYVLDESGIGFILDSKLIESLYFLMEQNKNINNPNNKINLEE